MNKVLADNIIFFFFCHYCYKLKKLECQEEIFKKKIIKKKKMVNVDDDEENFNEEISLQK